MTTPTPALTADAEDEAIARAFHEAYERLAPQFGYRTREASAVPWEDVPQANRDLMVATVASVKHVILARRVRESGCEGLADEARLVAQWSDAVDPMPDELRAELHDLGRHIAALAATEPVAPDDGRYASTVPLRSYSERTGRGAAAPEATCATCGHEKHQHPVDGRWGLACDPVDGIGCCCTGYLATGRGDR